MRKFSLVLGFTQLPRTLESLSRLAATGKCFSISSNDYFLFLAAFAVSFSLLALLSFYRHRLKLPHLQWSIKFAGNISCGRKVSIMTSTSAGGAVVCWMRSLRYLPSWWRRLGSSNHDCHVHVKIQ